MVDVNIILSDEDVRTIRDALCIASYRWTERADQRKKLCDLADLLQRAQETAVLKRIEKLNK